MIENPQIESFCNCIVNRVDLMPQKPSSYLVYGEAAENHSSLILRIAEIELLKTIEITKEEQVFSQASQRSMAQLWRIGGYEKYFEKTAFQCF